MIERIQVRNFQCHDDLRIVFDEKVTAIVGPSDVGKSAILRALRWVATNRPRGEGFVRNGTEEAAVFVWVDGVKLGRCKGKCNAYRIGDVELKAVGIDVPEDISNVLRLDGVNFQGQHESPFWFDLTGGELAKQLNSIVDLDVIDKVQSVLASRLRRSVEKRVVVEERLRSIEERLEELSFVDEMDSDFREVERLEEDRQETARLAKGLGESVQSWEIYQEKIESQETLRLLGVSVVDKGRKAKGLTERQSRLVELVERMEKAEEESKFKSPDVGYICSWGVEAINKRKESRKVDEAVQKWEGKKARLRKLLVDKKNIEEEWREKQGGVCPLCGRELIQE